MLPSYSSLSPPLSPSLRKGDHCHKISWFIACQPPIPPEELAGRDQVICDTNGGCRASRSAMGNRGHCILAISHLLLPARSHGGASSHPSTMPAFLTNITHATGTSVVVGTTETHAEAPCQPLRLTHAISQAHPCKTRGYPGLPEPAQYCCTLFKHQQKPAAHSRYGHLANLWPSKHLHSKHSPLHYSSILCQVQDLHQQRSHQVLGQHLGDGVLISQNL